jgi:hypothetical protein
MKLIASNPQTYLKAISLIDLSIVVESCSHLKAVATAPLGGVSCQIVERVYHDGWTTFGEIKISEAGNYTWRVRNLWSSPDQTHTFSGHLPTSISEQIMASSSSFELRDGVRLYELGIDNTMSRHPAGVDALRSYLHRRH